MPVVRLILTQWPSAPRGASVKPKPTLSGRLAAFASVVKADDVATLAVPPEQVVETVAAGAEAGVDGLRPGEHDRLKSPLLHQRAGPSAIKMS